MKESENFGGFRANGCFKQRAKLRLTVWIRKWDRKGEIKRGLKNLSNMFERMKMNNDKI